MPTVFGRALESPVVEPRCQVVEHPVGFGDDGSTGESATVSASAVPIRVPHLDPLRESRTIARWNGDRNWVVAHLAKPV